MLCIYKSWLMLLFILLLPHADSAKRNCTLPKPRNVYFSSVNLWNVLKWSPINVSGVLYNVEYKEYGETKWHKKIDCTRINNTWCDLSKETYNAAKEYYARVIVNWSGCSIIKKTERFDPKADTTFGSPRVEVQPDVTSILLKLSYPEFYNRSQESINGTFRGIKFNISINTTIKRTWKESNRILTVPSLNPDTTYCITVALDYYSIRERESAVKCVRTLKDPTTGNVVKILFLYVVPVIVTVLILCATVYFVHKYIHVGKLKQPCILNIAPGQNHSAIIVDACAVTINVISIDNDTCDFKMQDNCISTVKSTKNNSELQLLNGDDDEMNYGTETTEEEKLGYVTLQKMTPPAKSNISPYDMPHHLVNPETLSQSTALSNVMTEDAQYGISPLNEEITLSVTENSYEPQNILVKYVPRIADDLPVPIFKTSNLSICEVEEMFPSQLYDWEQEPNDSNLNVCDTLFINWSPPSQQLHIPNFNNKHVLDDVLDDEEGILSKLISPLHLENSLEEDDLLKFQERWGLHVQTHE